MCFVSTKGGSGRSVSPDCDFPLHLKLAADFVVVVFVVVVDRGGGGGSVAAVLRVVCVPSLTLLGLVFHASSQ